MKIYIKYLLFFILICNINIAQASYLCNSLASFNGSGIAEYPNFGYLKASNHAYDFETAKYCYTPEYICDGHSVQYYVSTKGQTYNHLYAHLSYSKGYRNLNTVLSECQGNAFHSGFYTDSDTTVIKAKSLVQGGQRTGSAPPDGYSFAHSYVTIVIYPDVLYNITGNISCLEGNVELYTNNIHIDSYLITGNNYTFKTLMSGWDYGVLFENGHWYNFSCVGNHIYDYDACQYYTLNLLDDCSNPLINPYTTIYRNEFIPFLLYQGYDNPINLEIGADIELGDDIDITVHTCDGDIMLNDPYVEERVRNMVHQDISWNLDITCEDDNTGAKLQGVNVIRTQDCCIIGDPSGYALTQSNGKVCFSGLANSNIDVTATKAGYATYDNTISVGNSFDCQTQGRAFTIYMNATSAGGNSTDDYNNGTHNDSENVDGAGEETLPSEHGFGCGVYFKNVDGYIVSSIYDTDAYVDMYWWVKNHGDGDSNLKFQYQLYTHWYTAQAYTVSNNTYEYRRIYNADFNDHTNSYRGYIYNATEGCNDIQTLKVLNHTYQNESNYRNLTSHCNFRHKLGGNQIDYRSNVEIKIYANSDNSTLLDITVNLMNGSTLEDSITYNWADFSNANPKWWVVWEPDYAYTSGYNYTVNITGFDGYQLDTDEVWTADIVGSELTVFVKDNYNQQVTHSTVFVEDWGSISTGDKNYVSIAGFPQGTYQYKATKCGYISSGWASVDMDSHESVTCVLVSETQTSITASKMTNAEIKAFFIPLMYLLLIMMLLGAFKFACGGK